MLRRLALACAFCVLSVVASFAQSPSGATPLRGFVPPFEILRTVRSAGFEPLAPPLREGTSYVVRAIDYRGVPMRVVVDARSGAIRDANRIVSGPGLYGPYMPGPYAPVYYGRLAPPPYPPADDTETGYGLAPFGTSDLSSGDRHSSGLNLIPLPRPRPVNSAVNEKKPIARPDVATSAPAAMKSEPSRGSAGGASAPAIND